MDEIVARHRLEIKQLEDKEAEEMKMTAAKGSKAEQKAKTKQVEEDISKLLKELDSKGYYNKSSINNFKDEAKRTYQEEEEEEGQPRVLDDLETDPKRQARLKQKMEISMKKVESSEFYKAFLKQLKSPEVSGHFSLMLGSETQLQMVIYGIGSIESDEVPRFQLSIAILMKREFDWVGNNIEVFDPIISATESSVINSLGCTVLSVNEEARREALKPTLFFIPYCHFHLYNNLLQANWRMDRLSNIASLGNSFQKYRLEVAPDQFWFKATKRIIAARRIITEFAIETVSRDFYFAFSNLSWHFFSTRVDVVESL